MAYQSDNCSRSNLGILYRFTLAEVELVEFSDEFKLADLFGKLSSRVELLCYHIGTVGRESRQMKESLSRCAWIPARSIATMHYWSPWSCTQKLPFVLPQPLHPMFVPICALQYRACQFETVEAFCPARFLAKC